MSWKSFGWKNGRGWSQVINFEFIYFTISILEFKQILNCPHNSLTILFSVVSFGGFNQFRKERNKWQPADHINLENLGTISEELVHCKLWVKWSPVWTDLQGRMKSSQ